MTIPRQTQPKRATLYLRVLTRSCSATLPKMAINKGRTGPPVSSQGSRTLMTCTPILSKSKTVCKVPKMDL